MNTFIDLMYRRKYRANTTCYAILGACLHSTRTIDTLRTVKCFHVDDDTSINVN